MKRLWKVLFLIILAKMVGGCSRGEKLEMIETAEIAQTVNIAHDDQPFVSNLPLVTVDSLGKTILDGDKINAKMQIFSPDAHGVTSLLNTSLLIYDGWIRIERRGASSGQFPKKQFSLETQTSKGEDDDVSLFDMPKEEDWILHAPYSDKTLMRNHLAYWISNEMGMWASRTKFVEAFIDEESNPYMEDQYWGVYLLMEKIKRDTGRVNIAKLKPTHTSDSKISGGYIFNVDRARTNPDDCVYSATGLTAQKCVRIIVPTVEKLNEAQRNYVVDYFSRFEQALASDDFTDLQVGYASFIDVDSFVDYLILHELFKNVDGFRHSSYLNKDRNGLIKAGPYWDCNLCMGNVDFYDGLLTNGWTLSVLTGIPFWWTRLLQDPVFVNKLNKRWTMLRQEILSTERIISKIDETANLLDEAQERNFARWPSIGVHVRFNPAHLARTYQEEVALLKLWLEQRLTWIDENIDTISTLGKS